MESVTLTYAELASRLGIGVESARIKARRRRWAVTLGNDGRARVTVPSEALPPTVPERKGNAGGALGATIPGLLQELQGVQERERRASAAAEQERALNAELRERIARLEGEAAGVRATAIADVTAAQAESAALRELVAELKAMLAEARRPWWRRWIR
jgi:hypothetical protein